MDWEPTPEQRLIRETSRRLLEQHCPVARVRELVEAGLSYDREVWAQGSALGWCGMDVPAELGGGGASAEPVVDLAILAEELGRAMHPGPFLSTNIVASAVARFGSTDLRDRHLPGLLAGRTVGAWAGGHSSATGTAGPSATAAPSGYRLTGTSRYVTDAAAAHLLLVTASLSGRPAQFTVPTDTPGVRVERLETLDLARGIAHVHFDETFVPAAAALGPDHDAAARVERQLQLALVMQCAETVGTTARGLEMTVSYAQDRVAFGRPIGSYQALKHRMATHRIRLEGAIAATAYAAHAVQHERRDAALAAHAAKAFVGKWSTVILHDCIQLTGGLGMTWDYDLHLYFRRAISNEQLLGNPDQHCRALVDIVERSAA